MRLRRILSLLVWLAVLVACAEEPVEYLDVDYAEWERTVDRDLTQLVPGHGAGLRRIFINRIGTDAMIGETGTIRYPDGTVIVKEAYTSPDPSVEDAPARILGMIKAPGSPESRGGWVWVVRNVATGKETVFAEEYCITCHGNANESHPYGDGNSGDDFRDYVFYPYMR